MSAQLAVPTEAQLSESAGWQLVQQAEQLVGSVNGIEDAEALWRKINAVEDAMRWARLSSAVTVAMGRVRLRAERRWGVLLGEAEHGGAREQVTGGNLKGTAERKAHHQARKVADVPEPVFEQYVAAEREDPPTRAGLLRAVPAQPKRRKRRSMTGPGLGGRRRTTVPDAIAAHDVAWREFQAAYDEGQERAALTALEATRAALNKIARAMKRGTP